MKGLLKSLAHSMGFHPQAWLDALFTYPRFLGRIKPQLLAAGEDEVRARLDSLHRAWETSPLTVPVGKRILVVSPHADDETIGAGGLLLAHRRRAVVHLVTVFNGEGGGSLPSGPWNPSSEYRSRLISARQAELKAVADQLGATTSFLGLPDGYSSPVMTDAEKLGEMVRTFRPDVVLLPWYLDNHPDHRMANILYAWSCSEIRALVLGFEVWSSLAANVLFELGPHYEEKLQLVKTYSTQLATVDYENYIRGLALSRAFQLGVGHKRNQPAEAFLAVPNRDYCELVMSLYGKPGQLSSAAQRIFGTPETLKAVK